MHLLGKTFEFGQNGLLARGADDAQARITADKVEKGWDGLNIVPKTQVEAIIRVYLGHFDLSGPVAGQFVKHRIQDLAWPAPRSPKTNKNRSLGLQDFRLEIQARDNNWQ